MQFWNELEGRVIHGRHPLTRLVRSEGRTAWFDSEAGDPAGTPATISLIEALTDADEVTERLQAAQSLQQPNMVSISKVGQVTLDDTLFVYAVMGHIEQSLADVLQGQALSADEGREVAEALVAALTAIHQKGWSHGHVEAASVLATETAVQLRSDCLQLNPAGQADDVAGIGVTLFHAFTQRQAPTATDAQVNRIPAPFAEIVRNTFARRWTLAQVANALKPAPPVVPTVAAAPAVAPVVTPLAPPTPPPARAPEPKPVAPPVAPAPPKVAPAPAPVPAARLEPLPPQAEKFEPEPEARPAAAAGQRKPFLLYGTIALVVLALLAFFLFKPRTATEPAQQAAAPAPTSPSTLAPVPAAPAPAAKPAATKPSAAAKSSAARPAPVAATPASAANGRSIWRVIAYTYRYEKPAQEMVDKLKGEHPNLDVAVFTPRGKTTLYLISLGGAMTHEEALKMRDKAASMGLPADTFVQNFSE